MVEEHLSTSKAAQLLGVSERTVQLWLKKRKFPGAYKLDPDASNSPYRIPLADVEAIQAKRKASPITVEKTK